MSTHPTPADKKPRRRWLRRSLFALASLVLILLLLALLLPTLVSTGAGTALALSIANGYLPGHVAVADLSVGWFSGTHLHGVTLADPDGKTVATLDALDADDATLLALLTGKRQLGELVLTKPIATVVRYADGSTNIERALVAPRDKSAPAKPASKPRPTTAQDQEATPIGKLLPRFTLKQIDGQVTYSDAATLPVVLNTPSILLAVDHDGRVGLDFDANVNQGDDTGRVTGSIQLTHLWNDQGQLQLAAAATDADVSLSSIPIEAVDRLLNQNGLLTALIGPTLTASLKAQGDISKLQAVLTAHADNLDINLRTDTAADADGNVTLTTSAGSPSTAKLLFTPDAYAKLTQSDASGGGGGAKLLQPVVMELELRKLHVRQNAGGVDLAGAAVDLGATVSAVQLDAGGEVGRIGLTGTTLHIQSQRLADGLTAALTADAAQQGRPSGHVSLTAAIRNLIDAHGQLQPGAAAAQVSAKVGQFPLAVADELARQNGLLVKNLGPTLNLTADADLTNDAQGGLPTGSAKVSAQSERLTLNATGQLRGNDPITANFDVNWREPTTNAALAATGDATVRNAVGSSDSAKPMTAAVNLNVAQAPVGMIDQLAGQNGQLTALLGDAIQNIKLSADATLGAAVAATVRVKVDDDLLKADLGADYAAGKPLAVRDNSTAGLTVTPSAFAALQKSPAAGSAPAGKVALRLEEPVTLQLAVKKAVVPIDGGFDPSRMSAALSASTSRMVLREPGQSGQRFAISNFVLNLDALDPRAAVTLDFDGKIERLAAHDAVTPPPAPTSTSGGVAAASLRSHNRLTQLFTDAGAMNFAAARIATDTQLASLPVAMLDAFLGMDGQLGDTFGDTASVSVAGALPGDLDVKLTSPQAAAAVPLQLSQAWQVTLRQDAVATLAITERLIKSWLGQAMPMLADAVSSDQPVKLTLEAKRFGASLQAFDIKKVTAFGKLELGTVQMRRRGWLAQGITGGLGLLGQQLGLNNLGDLFGRGNAETYPAAFSPIAFRLRNGNLRLWESWLTSPDLALGFNGVVDLNKSRIDLTLGVLGATFLKGMGAGGEIAQFIDPAMVYESPVTGPLGSPDIKWDKLLGQLIAARTTNTVLGGAKGILGDIIPDLDHDQDDSSDSKRAWHVPASAQPLIQSVQLLQPQQPKPANPITPEERERRRQLRQQRQQEQDNQNQNQNPKPNPKPKSNQKPKQKNPPQS
jgi:hypothetical protein